jgi:hypothetical protein
MEFHLNRSHQFASKFEFWSIYWDPKKDFHRSNLVFSVLWWILMSLIWESAMSLKRVPVEFSRELERRNFRRVELDFWRLTNKNVLFIFKIRYLNWCLWFNLSWMIDFIETNSCSSCHIRCRCRISSKNNHSIFLNCSIDHSNSNWISIRRVSNNNSIPKITLG